MNIFKEVSNKSYNTWPGICEKSRPLRNANNEMITITSGWYKELLEDYLLKNNWIRCSLNVYAKDIFLMHITRKTICIKYTLEHTIDYKFKNKIPRVTVGIKEFLQKGEKDFTFQITDAIFNMLI